MQHVMTLAHGIAFTAVDWKGTRRCDAEWVHTPPAAVNDTMQWRVELHFVGLYQYPSTSYAYGNVRMS